MLTHPSYLSGRLVRWRGSRGDDRLSVVCRASYRLEPDVVRRLDEPTVAVGVDAPFKAATDVIVVGRGVREPVRLEVGDIDKTLSVAEGQLSGCGPLATTSPERRHWLGPRAADWQEEQLAAQGFPADADWRYWNVAPIDQQLVRPLAPDERLVLELGGAPLATQLAGERAVGYAAPRATAKASEAEPIEMHADTLWIDLDRRICTVSWRGQLDASPDGEVFVALVRGEADFESVRRMARADASPVEELTTDDIVAVAPAGALPFMSAATRAPERPSLETTEDERRATGTLGPGELERAMGSLTANQREAAPWLAAPPAPTRPTSPQAQARASAWAPPAQGSSPPPGPPPAPPPGIGAPPKRAPTHPPSAPAAVLSPAMFAAASVAVHTSAPPAAPAPAPSVESEANRATSTAMSRSEHTQLLWHDRTAMERVRAHFEELVDELEFVEPDPKRDLLVEDPAAAKDHHHCLGILSRGNAGGAHGLQEAFAEAGREGAFVAPIALVEGELRPSFDEVKELELLVALLTPLTRGDDKLRTELDEVSKLFDNPIGLRVGDTAERIGRELRTLFSSKHRAAVDGLEGKIERLLLEDRAFATRSVLGADHVRATLKCPDDDAPVVVYLPEEVAAALPLFPSFRARLLGEVHPQQDAIESQPLALLAVALGRLVRPDQRRWVSSARR